MPSDPEHSEDESKSPSSETPAKALNKPVADLEARTDRLDELEFVVAAQFKKRVRDDKRLPDRIKDLKARIKALERAARQYGLSGTKRQRRRKKQFRDWEGELRKERSRNERYGV